MQECKLSLLNFEIIKLLMKRLFTGTFIDFSSISDKINSIQDRIRPTCQGKWVEPENLHFTYSFIGDIEDDKADEIQNALKEYTIQYQSVIELNGISLLPNLSRPRVMYIKVINEDRLVSKIQREMEKRLAKFAVQADKRPYKPHISLIRIKSITDEFAEAYDSVRSTNFCKIPTFKISLVESKLYQSGPVYKIIQ